MYDTPGLSAPKPLSKEGLWQFLNDPKLKSCMSSLQYEFHEPVYLLEALWHKSLKSELQEISYERLEFLGDSILQLYTCLKLYNLFPNFQEGELTKSLSNIVSARPLSQIAKDLKLNEYIFITDPLKDQISDSILADVYESIVAAIFADGGLEQAFKFMEYTLSGLFEEPLNHTVNYKSKLQEYTQKNKLEMPVYEVIELEGPGHELIFKTIIHVCKNTYGPVTAKSKKEADQKVAKLALEKLDLL